MRLFSVLMALLVAGAIYAFVFERARLVAMMTGQQDAAAEAAVAQAETPQAQVTRVVVQRSEAREIDSAVVLRGRTEADRVDRKSVV